MMRCMMNKRLFTSIILFIIGLLLTTSLLTNYVNNDMYMGTVQTGEDYYYSSVPKEIPWLQNISFFSYDFNDSLINNSTSNIQAINIAIIVKNATTNQKILQDFQGCAESIMKYAVKKPLHFVLLTDEKSINGLNLVVRKLARVRAHVPITVDYVDLDKAIANTSAVITRLKRNFAPEEITSKYRNDLFHVGPLYHRLLPNSTTRLLVVDADLRFRADVSELYFLFHQFKENELMAIAKEMSPIYFDVFEKDRELHNSKNGLYAPNGFPGLNSGVVLYNLANMRQNVFYNELLDIDGKLEDLRFKFGNFEGAKVGDQDFFTLLKANDEECIKLLDCGWNIQLDNSMKSHPLYESYHKCNSTMKLIHGNGGIEIPQL